MKYLLDTDICIYLIKNKPPTVLARFMCLSMGDVGISSVTLSELEYGVEKSARSIENRLALAAFLAALEVIPYDQRAAEKYGRLRAYLEKNGQMIGALDLLIAAHALANNFTLVTNNEREFRRIPGLVVENWTIENDE